MQSVITFAIQSVQLQSHSCVLVRPHVTGNGVIKMRSDQQNFGPSPNPISWQWLMKSRNSQHASAKVRVIQGALPYSSTALQPISVNETRVIVEMTVPSINNAVTNFVKIH